MTDLPLNDMREAAEAARDNPPKGRIGRGDDAFAALAARDLHQTLWNPANALALLDRLEKAEGALRKIDEGGPDIGPVTKPTYTHGFDQGCAWSGRIARASLNGEAG